MLNDINILTNYKQQPAWAKLKLNKQREDQSVVDPGQDTRRIRMISPQHTTVPCVNSLSL